MPIDPENRGRGRRPEQNRAVVNGILWRLRCGAPWHDVPPKYGSWNTIYRRFRRWSEAGVW
ncbi:transposase [Sphingomonas colocasiae]|uniref:transposase n=1 Tax=Sphingomonas colocasiae TaxID=1848973 RepID=UPI003CCECE9D